MHDPRNATALRQLADLGHDPDPPRWVWAVARLGPYGRVVLSVEARGVLGARAGQRTEVAGVCNRVALVLRADGGGGAAMAVDARGRLCVPAWLRRGAPEALLVGTCPAAALVVVASTAVLDSLGDLLTRGSR